MFLLWITAGISVVGGVGAALLVDAFLTDRVALLGSFAGLQYSLNDGIAFGMRIPGPMQFVLIVAALIFVVWYAWKEAKTTLAQIGFGLILGGGSANIIDRFLDGHVTDFFQIGSFPVFNVADSCITIGIVVLFYEMVILSRKK